MRTPERVIIAMFFIACLTFYALSEPRTQAVSIVVLLALGAVTLSNPPAFARLATAKATGARDRLRTPGESAGHAGMGPAAG